jgi:hypothetical protein
MVWIELAGSARVQLLHPNRELGAADGKNEMLARQNQLLDGLSNGSVSCAGGRCIEPAIVQVVVKKELEDRQAISNRRLSS